MRLGESNLPVTATRPPRRPVVLDDGLGVSRRSKGRLPGRLLRARRARIQRPSERMVPVPGPAEARW